MCAARGGAESNAFVAHLLAALRLARYNTRNYTGGMVVTGKLRKIGNSLGVALPKEVLNRLDVSEGDSLCLTEATDGSLRLTPSRSRGCPAVGGRPGHHLALPAHAA